MAKSSAGSTYRSSSAYRTLLNSKAAADQNVATKLDAKNQAEANLASALAAFRAADDSYTAVLAANEVTARASAEVASAEAAARAAAVAAANAAAYAAATAAAYASALEHQIAGDASSAAAIMRAAAAAADAATAKYAADYEAARAAANLAAVRASLNAVVAGSGDNLDAARAAAAAAARAADYARYLFDRSTADLLAAQALQASIQDQLNIGSYPVTFTTTSSACSIVSGSLHVLGAGACSVTAYQAGDGTYDSGTVVQSVTITKLTQVINFAQPTISNSSRGDQRLLATSSAGSAYPVSFTTASSTCSIVSGALHLLSAGPCTITASQAGDAIYNASENVSKTVTINRLLQTLTFTQALTDMTACPISAGWSCTPSPAQALVASSSAGNDYPITFLTAQGPGTYCFVNSNPSVMTNGTGGGSCQITATQAGDALYLPASKIITITIRMTQNPLYISTSSTSNYAKGNSGVTLTSIGGSGGGAITYITTSSGCTISGSKLSVSTNYRAGSTVSCSVTASKAANGIYAATTSSPAINFSFR